MRLLKKTAFPSREKHVIQNCPLLIGTMLTSNLHGRFPTSLDSLNGKNPFVESINFLLWSVYRVSNRSKTIMQEHYTSLFGSQAREKIVFLHSFILVLWWAFLHSMSDSQVRSNLSCSFHWPTYLLLLK